MIYIRPWRSWITQRIPIPENGSSNLFGRARKQTSFVFWTKGVCFQRNLPLLASEIAALRNINFVNVKYSLTRMWANFISHCDKGAIFHNDQRALFHVRRIFHFNYSCDYDIVVFRKVIPVWLNQNFAIYQWIFLLKS